MIRAILLLSSTMLFTLGCGTKYPRVRLGQFTMASSHNVRNLNYSVQDKTKASTVGEDCFNLGNERPNDARLQRAMDAAIKAGQEKGLDGDLLVNVRIDHQVKEERSMLLFVDHYDCMIVTGDLVKIQR